MVKVDSIIKTYLAHKKAILSLADDKAIIEAYDITTDGQHKRRKKMTEKNDTKKPTLKEENETLKQRDRSLESATHRS